MCALIAIIATNLTVTLQHMDRAALLKCNGHGLESWLAGHLDKRGVHLRGGQYVNVWGN